MKKYKSKYSLYFFDKKYNPSEIEPRWQKKWLKTRIFQPEFGSAKRPFYNLMMFPYPSAEGLHVGNMYAFTGADIYGRFKRMQGHDVFEPIGLDGFGIHSENYALKIGEHPAKLAKKTQENFYRQLHATGNAYSWANKLETYDLNYYKWTQWIFIQMFKNGLAYRKKAAVNWCPNCQTTLSDEQVISGACERCKTQVEERELEQWFFRITDYADRLLDGLTRIDWTEKVKIAQRNWIGKSEGALIKFQVPSSKFQIEVFTTRPDTIYGATFIVLSPGHPLVAHLRGEKPDDWRAEKAVKTLREWPKDSPGVEGTKEKTGYFTGLYCLNPLRQLADEKIPIWVSDYVVSEYGTGAIMGVPFYDERDLEFAKKYKLPIKKVPLENMEEITQKIVKNGWGEKKVQYHLRDWCISRQRYWGPPIPMINCQKCGWQPVPEEDLPVLLPDVADWRPKGEGTSPLARCKDWLKIACPQCRGPARRETDVSDTFLDSAWYFLRYPSVYKITRRTTQKSSRSAIKMSREELPWDPQITKKWLPVNMYIGGAEHSVLHLMYSRFLTMVFHDLGLLEFEEPFKKFYAHGLLIAEGAKMSKSRGNVIVPDEYIKTDGADTLRCYLMFLGPFSQGGDFRDTGIAGMWRFLNRVWRLVAQDTSDGPAERGHPSEVEELERLMHQTIKEVTEDIENLRYNTALAKIMEYVNKIVKTRSKIATPAKRDSKLKIANSKLSREAVETLVLLLAPFAPHLTEELWQNLNVVKNARSRVNFAKFSLEKNWSVHQQSWPKYNPKLMEEETAIMVIEVNGKVRDKIKLQAPSSKLQAEIEKLAQESEKIKKYLAGKKIRRAILVPGKLLNFVTD